MKIEESTTRNPKLLLFAQLGIMQYRPCNERMSYYVPRLLVHRTNREVQTGLHEALSPLRGTPLYYKQRRQVSTREVGPLSE